MGGSRGASEAAKRARCDSCTDMAAQLRGTLAAYERIKQEREGGPRALTHQEQAWANFLWKRVIWLDEKIDAWDRNPERTPFDKTERGALEWLLMDVLGMEDQTDAIRESRKG